MSFTSKTPIYTESERKGVLKAADLCRFNNYPVLWKKVNRARHFMRVLKGYGMQEDVYNGYVKDTRGWVVIEESPSGAYYVAEMKGWMDNGKTMSFVGIDGTQRFLSTKHMKKLASIDKLTDWLAVNPPEEVAQQQPLLRFP
jgi:hypothetical protein